MLGPYDAAEANGHNPGGAQSYNPGAVPDEL